MTLALCPCGHCFTPLVVQDPVTLSADVNVRTISTDIDLQWLKPALCYCTLCATLSCRTVFCFVSP